MLKRAIALVTLTALGAGCAAPARTPPPVREAPAALVPPPTPPAPEALPPMPPTVIAPRPPAPPAEPLKAAEPAAPLPPPPTAPEVPPAMRGRFIVLNFDNADVETVIQAASEIVGFNYVLGPGVSGKKVTVQTSGRVAQEDVFGVLLAILEVSGVTAVKAGNLYKIVTIEGARARAVPTIVGARPDPARTSDEIITQIVPLRYTSVTDLSTLLRPLISPLGSLIAHRETNVLIVTDTASNVARLLDITRLVDVQVALEELQIIAITFADATQLATILNQLFASGRIRSLAPGAVPPVTPPAAPGAVAPPQTGSPVERQPLIIAEQRSNSVIVHARKHEIETIKGLIGQLDVNIYGGRRVFVYYAENAKSKDLSSTLNQIYGREAGAGGPTPPPTTAGRVAGPPPPPPPGQAVVSEGLAEGQVRFIADEVTNSLIVTTYPRLWQEIEGTIRQLDRMPRQVLIEVLVAEIKLTDDMRLGIDWAVREGRFNVGGTFANSATTTALPTSPGPGGGGLSLPAQLGGPASVFGPIGQGLTAFSFATDRFFAILNALASDNRVNIVSSPHVLTSENKKAVINVSTSVPIITGQQTSTISQPGQTGGTTSTSIITGGVNQTVEYRDAGVILTVTPRIGERGTVALDVKQEVNSVGAATPPTGSPSFEKREAETSVVLVNNQTLVLGGLIQDRTTIDERGIPFLKDIPLIGLLFGFKARRVEKTELLLLITPRVVGTALDAAKITEQMRRSTPDLNDAIRRAPRQPSIAPPRAAPPPGGGGGVPAPAPESSPAPPPAAPGAPAPAPAPPR
jgi:general secretion pathway protein D